MNPAMSKKLLAIAKIASWLDELPAAVRRNESMTDEPRCCDCKNMTLTGSCKASRLYSRDYVRGRDRIRAFLSYTFVIASVFVALFCAFWIVDFWLK